MSTRHAGRKTVETTVYVRVCDECENDIDTSTPAADEQRIVLNWGVLDCWWGDEDRLPDSPVDLCSVACARAFFDRAERVMGDVIPSGSGATS